jgi:dephospho-CoA kinase
MGYPSCGKSFMADYLATLGWENVDGDWILQESDPKVLAKYEGME